MRKRSKNRQSINVSQTQYAVKWSGLLMSLKKGEVVGITNQK